MFCENLIDLIDNLKESMFELRVENLRQNSIVNYIKKNLIFIRNRLILFYCFFLL